MAEGLTAVRSALATEFGQAVIHEQWSASSQETHLAFSSEGRDFRVWVTKEYDDDYASGQLRVDLRSLGRVLRGTSSGAVRISTKGIQGIA